nr:Hypothetical protein [Raoultella ornithinolytica]
MKSAGIEARILKIILWCRHRDRPRWIAPGSIIEASLQAGL